MQLSHTQICHALFALKARLASDRLSLQQRREANFLDDDDALRFWETTVRESEQLVEAFEAASRVASAWEPSR